jgi:hypothetical protein
LKTAFFSFEELKFTAKDPIWSRVMLAAILGFSLSGCAAVQETHLDGWLGQPVATLAGHPNLAALPVIRTITPDGTRLWRYLDGFDTSKCSEGNRIFSSDVNYKTYERFAVCMSGKAACNHIFYIINATVVNYALIATGDASCKSNAKWGPGYRGGAP